MPFKLNMSEKGKSYKVESSSESFIGKKIGEKIFGKDLDVAELNEFEFEITGASDKSGFPAIKNVEGVGLKRRLLTYGKGMKKRSKKEGKKKRAEFKPDGLRLRKTVHGNTLTEDIIQINLKVTKEGSKPLAEIYKKEEKPAEEKPTA